MKSLTVPLLAADTNDLRLVSGLLDKTEIHNIDQAPWHEQFPYHPEVNFSIAHNNRSVFLKYRVREESIKAEHQTINAPVYLDSCVEFFISFEEDKYYNFEFNYTGNVLGCYGKTKPDRDFLDEALLKNIRTCYTVETADQFEWRLTVQIPVTTFCFHNFQKLSGVNCRANFYKCGDDLPKPHYLAWNAIESSQPNFHLPEFFGQISFE